MFKSKKEFLLAVLSGRKFQMDDGAVYWYDEKEDEFMTKREIFGELYIDNFPSHKFKHVEKEIKE